MTKSKKNTVMFAVMAALAVIFFLTVTITSFVLGKSGNNKVDKGLRYNYMHIAAEWRDDRTCVIENEFEAQFMENPTEQAPNHGVFVDIPVNAGQRISDVRVTNITPRVDYEFEFMQAFNILRIRVGDADRSFFKDDTLGLTVSYVYEMPSHKSGNDVLALMALGAGYTSEILDARVTVKYPVAPLEATDDFGIYIGENFVSPTDNRVVWSDDGRIVTVNAGALAAYTGVELAYQMPKGTIGAPAVGIPQIIIIVLGALLFVGAILIKIFVMKNKPVTPVVDFYPPRIDAGNGKMRHMLPVQMGKIIDGSCSSEDVTSLVFYWASKGYIRIDERKDDTYLIKLRSVHAVRGYEKAMFQKIFEKAEENDDGNPEVSLSELSGKLYTSISATKTAVNNEYKNKFYTKSSVIGVAVMVLCALYSVMTGLLLTWTIAPMFFNIAAIATVIPVVVAYALGSVIANYYYKLSEKKRAGAIFGYAVLIALLTFGVSMLIPMCVMGWAVRIPFIIAVGGLSGVAPFLIKRTDWYNEQLNSILGFRNFLRDARKDELETLLKDDPQYYYDILPYANVLGVSKIWSDKFKDMTVEPPEYIRSYRSFTFFDFYIFHRITSTVGRGLSYVPPKVSSGSFSSGGSFGGGGGGFSGGSFGGGGGGRW